MNISMVFGCFFMVMHSMKMVTVSYVSMMSGLLVVAFIMELGGFLMMFCGQLQMLSGVSVVFRAFRH